MLLLRKRFLLPVAFVGLMVAIAALNWDGGEGHPGPLTLYDGQWSEDDADLSGTLVREGPCLYVESEGRRTLVSFSRHGTRWDEREQAVHAGGLRIGFGEIAVRFGGATLHVGDEVRLGGGGGSQEALASTLWAVPPHPACDTASYWISGKP